MGLLKGSLARSHSLSARSALYAGGGDRRPRGARRARTLISCLLALLAVGLCLAPTPAAAAADAEKTDVMFVFDTSGSMDGVLGEAQEEIADVIEHISATVPNTAFGVANVEDIPGYIDGDLTETKTETEYEEDPEKPWRLDQSVTTEQSKVLAAIQALSGPDIAHYGGDGPEAYGRALWETDTNPQVGWRAGARHEIVLIADQVPHTPNVNEGIPEEDWLENPFDTHTEPPGRWGIAGTVWKPGDDIEFQADLQQLAHDGKPLEMVDYHDTEGDYIHYWEHWAGETGGQAIEAQENGKELSSKLITQIEAGADATLPACPAGETRAPDEECETTPATATWTGPAYERVVGSLGGPLLGPVETELELVESLTPSITASESLLPTAAPPTTLTPDLPDSLNIDTPVGNVSLGLGSGATSGAPAGVSADPPYPGLFNLEPPSLDELGDATHPEDGWFSIPIGKGTRSITLTLAAISPLSFAATLEYDLAAKCKLNQLELEALAVVVAATVILAVVPEAAAAIAGALASDGLVVAASAIGSALVEAIPELLASAGGAIVEVISTIPEALAGAASDVWSALTGLASFAHTNAHAAPAPIEGPPTSAAKVLALRRADLRGLKAQLLRGALAKAAGASLLSLPTSTTVRPLVASKRFPRGGQTLTILGGHLPGTKAQLVIAGPGYAAVRDVRITHGLAGGRIVLPAGRKPGRWYAGVVDYNGLHASHGHLRGHTILEAASWVAG
jgi:hypothetical protein